MEALHEGGVLLHQSFTAHYHLAGADTGLLGQAPQRQILETQLHRSLLLHLQPGHTTKNESVTKLMNQYEVWCIMEQIQQAKGQSVMSSSDHQTIF